MGSFPSKLTCPKNFDKQDFAAICRLYDILDSNGDFCVNQTEVQHIADIHVRNKIEQATRELQQQHKQQLWQQQLFEQRTAKDIARIREACEAKIEEVEAKRSAQLTNLKAAHATNDEDIQTNIDQWTNATDTAKRIQFVNVVSVDDEISFNEFFKYMKTRTDDMRTHYPTLYGERTGTVDVPK